MSCLIQSLLGRGLTSAVALVLFSVLHACSGPGSTSVAPPSGSATTYYLDCSAVENGNGTQASPWNSPASVNAFTFLPGDLLLLNGGSAQAALTLFNQQYWEINNLEITGGNRYGVYVSGNTPNVSINHIYLRNLNVHGATYTSTKRADSGEVVIFPNGAGQIVNDVLIDGVTAHDSQVSEGIFVSAGGAWTNGASQPLGNNVTVQNSTA